MQEYPLQHTPARQKILSGRDLSGNNTTLGEGSFQSHHYFVPFLLVREGSPWIILIPIFYALMFTLLGCSSKRLEVQRYLSPYDAPGIHINAVTVPLDRSQPLDVNFEIAASGKTPVAVSQEQISFAIFGTEHISLFHSRPLFKSETPRIFIVHPDRPLTVRATTPSDRVQEKKDWSSLTQGKYHLRIYINSGKSREFDYQWLGQTYSDDYEFQIK